MSTQLAFQQKKMKDEDWEAVRSIYLQGIATGNAIFETDAPPWEEWDKSHLRDCRLVARDRDQVLRWAALSPVSSRCVYSGVAEVSVYVAESVRGRGQGKLSSELLLKNRNAPVSGLQAGILPENTPSIALHKACGFREVGYRERIGQMNGVWGNVILMERRSEVVGIQ